MKNDELKCAVCLSATSNTPNPAETFVRGTAVCYLVAHVDTAAAWGGYVD